MPDKQKHILRLYVEGETSSSRFAVNKLKQVYEDELQDSFALEVVDVLKQPKSATDKKIIAAGSKSREDQRFRRLLDSIPDAALVVDGDGLVLYLNHAAEELFNRSAEQMLGCSFDFPLMAGAISEVDLSSGQEVPRVAEMRVAKTIWDNEAVLIATLRDITVYKQAEEHLAHLARHDILTGLPNRSSFNQDLHRAINGADRSGKKVGVIFLDLDGFKEVNDTHGHDVGDQLLKKVAVRLRESLRNGDILSRLGGDEFVVCLEDLDSPDGASAVAIKILQSFSRPFEIEQTRISISASLGISMYPSNGSDAVGLVQSADQAMYEAKKAGRNTARFFNKRLNKQAMLQYWMAERLRQAVTSQEFKLLFQPQIDPCSGLMVAAEALLRWHDHLHGWRRAGRFIKIAELNGLLLDLGSWALEQACRTAKQWQCQIPVAVNLSLRQTRDPSLPDRIKDVLARTGLPPERLRLEIPSSFLMRQEEEALPIIGLLRQLGVVLSLDDFGPEPINIQAILRSGITHLSIDRSCLQNVPGDPVRTEILRGLLSITQALTDCRVVVEGVETAEQMDYLAAYQGIHLQGYYLARPTTSDSLSCH